MKHKLVLVFPNDNATSNGKYDLSNKVFIFNNPPDAIEYLRKEFGLENIQILLEGFSTGFTYVNGEWNGRGDAYWSLDLS